MPSLTTQQDLRQAQRLPFCYLCGKAFMPGEKTTRDHLPPTALFAKEDRDRPLILPTHGTCNARELVSDELLGELVGLFNGRPIGPTQRPMRARVAQAEGQKFTQIENINFHAFIRRCVRGFHAALYGQWLPSETYHVFHPPMHAAQFDGKTGKPTDRVQEMLAKDEGLGQHAVFAEVLKKNRYAKNTDKVITRNGKCIYECVWSHTDDGRPICVFGLRIYDWENWGTAAGFEPRGCVGIYGPKAGRSANATTETELEFPFSNKYKLDPFGD